MEYLVYTSADESTQFFVGILLITFLSFIILANFYFWASEKIKKNE